MNKVTLVFALSVLLLSCASGYEELKGDYQTGGFTNDLAYEDITIVKYSGNTFTSQEKVRNYLLFRCAELAREQNKPYFSMYHSLGDAIEGNKESKAYFTVGHLGVYTHHIAFVFVKFSDVYESGDMITESIYEKYYVDSE